MTACGYTTQPPAYNPEGAKKLLAEAGYKDGFELQIADYMQETAATAIKVTGDLHKIGIKASVQKHTFTTLRKARDDGKLQALVAYYTMAGGPDASAGLDFFYREESRDYARDKSILEGMDKAAEELDEEKRRAIYQTVFDRINDQSYIMTMTTLPTVFVHTKEISIRPGSLEPYGALGRDFFWN
jgi:peptide/nickel transport system substrate-binding protein